MSNEKQGNNELEKGMHLRSLRVDNQYQNSELWRRLNLVLAMVIVSKIR
jgi:hypothetical protein